MSLTRFRRRLTQRTGKSLSVVTIFSLRRRAPRHGSRLSGFRHFVLVRFQHLEQIFEQVPTVVAGATPATIPGCYYAALRDSVWRSVGRRSVFGALSVLKRYVSPGAQHRGTDIGWLR